MPGRSRISRNITFRLRLMEYEILELIAAKNGISVHELCRRIVIAYLKSKGYII